MNNIKNKERLHQTDAVQGAGWRGGASRGSILIMAIILGSGMLVAAVEVSMFVVSTIRQARAIDHTLVAFYAAESGIESALHQIRKEGSVALRDDSKQSPPFYRGDGRDARWSFLPDGEQEGDPDPNKFSSVVQKITKHILGEQQSLDIHLWMQDANGFSTENSQFKTMVVRWQKEECAEGRTPWIETTGLVFDIAGRGMSWRDAALKKDFQQPAHDMPKSITVELATFLPSGEQLDNDKALTLRMKPFFCALRGLEISFPKKDTPAELMPIPNYTLIRPTATFGSVSKELQVIMPKHPTATGIFDYTLFSEEQIEKSEE